MSEKFDYIVVGGGSAGCIVAAELSDEPQVRVLLLEAGPAAEDHPETLSADGYKHAFINDSVMIERFSEPQAHAGRQRIFAGTGGVLGGSGSVNGMVYTRGSREDYAEWPEGWHWDDVVPDFDAIEGKLRPHRRPQTDWNEACIASAETQGFRRKEDLNDGDMHNVIGYEWMSYEAEGRRSSYVAFIKDAGAKANLTVHSGARVLRILFDDAKSATGVEFDCDGRIERAIAPEVVLCAGALETPKLLMLSGVGPAGHLREFGVPLVADIPTVGSGLHDHPNVPVFFKARKDIDCLYPQLYSFYRTNPDSALPATQSDTCYVYWPARSAMRQMTQRMMPPTVIPRSLYGPRSRALVRALIRGVFAIPPVANFADHMFGIILILGKPKSRGTLRLRSRDVCEQAAIDPGYYADADDMETMVRGVKIARRIGRADGLAGFGAKELIPGPRVKDDAAIVQYVRKNTITTYHFAGSCRMGTDDGAPVDPQLRLKGVSGLTIADASVIPWTPVSALNAPSMLVGYRAARLLEEQRRRV